MSNFKTLHIFGYGETQLIGEDLNIKVDSTSLTSLAALVNNIKSLRPDDVIEADYHVIHVFNGVDVKYLAHSDDKDQKKTFILKFDQIDQSLLDALTQELEARI